MSDPTTAVEPPGLHDIMSGSDAPVPPCRIYVFGATGDMVSKRESRDAIVYLAEHGILKHESNPLILFGSHPRPTSEFLKIFHDGDELSHKISEAGYDAFLKLAGMDGNPGEMPGLNVGKDEDFDFIKKDAGDAPALFYAALPPKMYEDMLNHLSDKGLVKDESRTVLLEKPFGTDLASAQALEKIIETSYKPGQVILADHFLAYPGTLNMLSYRTHPEFDKALRAENISGVEVRLLEVIKSNDRPYFRETGLLVDMIQSHALELLATFAMELPEEFSGPALQEARLRFLNAVKVDPETVRSGQYDGFNDPKEGAPPNAPASNVETYVDFAMSIDCDRWRGVPVKVQCAKGVSKSGFSVEVHFKKLPEGLASSLGVKPGQSATLSMKVNAPQKLEWVLPDENRTIPVPSDPRVGSEPPHALLIPDALHGVRGLFVAPKEALRAWEITELLQAQLGKRVVHYKPGADYDSIK